RVQDNVVTENGGQDTSSGNSMSLNVTSVNDAPSFTAGADQATTDENPATHGPALQQSVSGFASNLLKGATNESGQTLHFNVTPVTQSIPATPTTPATPGDDSFFTADGQPAIYANGNLTFKAA